MLAFLPAKLKIEEGIVTISNLSKKTLHRDFKRVFETSRINKHLFHESSSNSIRFNEFFALELYHILELVKGSGYLGTSIRKIEQIQNLLMTETWLSGIDKEQDDILDTKKLSLFNFSPLQHQSDFIKYYNDTVPRYKLKGMLLAAAAGSGKTFLTLAISECLNSDIIIVICPKIAMETVWLKSTIGKDSLYKKDPSVWATTSKLPYANEHILIGNYEAIDKILAITAKFKNKKVSIILDESHNLNEMKSLRTQSFLELCKDTKSDNVFLATGTPIKALGVETVPLLSAIDPLFTDEVKAMFVKLYAGEASKLSEILTRRLNVVSFKVSKDALKLSEPISEDIIVTIPDGDKYTLKAIARDIADYVKVRTVEIDKMLPEATVFFYKVLDEVHRLMTNKNMFSTSQINDFNQRMHTYRANLEDIKTAYKRGNLSAVNKEMAYCNTFEKNSIIPCIVNRTERERFKEVKSMVKYPNLKIKGECLGRILGKKRIEAHMAMCKAIPFEDVIESTSKKTVIFTSYVEVVDKVEDEVRKLGYRPLKVHGEFTSDLKGIVNRFEKDKSINPLIATYASLSTAVPLVMADTMIVINPPFREYIMKQTIARIHRIGTNTQTRIFNVILDTGVDKNISARGFDIVQWSKEQSEAILDLKTSDNVPGEDSVSLESYHLDLKKLSAQGANFTTW